MYVYTCVYIIYIYIIIYLYTHSHTCMHMLRQHCMRSLHLIAWRALMVCLISRWTASDSVSGRVTGSTWPRWRQQFFLWCWSQRWPRSASGVGTGSLCCTVACHTYVTAFVVRFVVCLVFIGNHADFLLILVRCMHISLAKCSWICLVGCSDLTFLQKNHQIMW